MNRCFLFFIGLIGCFSSFSQSEESSTTQATSILEKINQTRNPNTVLGLLEGVDIEAVPVDTLKAYLYYFKGTALGQLTQLDSAMVYVEKAQASVDLEKHPVLAIQIHRAIGNIYWSKGFLNLSLDNYQYAVTISDRIKSDEFLISVYANIAGVYAKLDNFPLALEYAYKAEEISKRSGALLPRSHMKIGMYQISLGQYEEAIFSIKETIRRIQVENKDSIALGYCYDQITKANLKLGKIDSARYYINIADRIMKNINYSDANHYTNRAQVEIAEGRLVEAERNIKEAIRAGRERRDLSEVMNAKMIEKNLLMKQEKFQKVIKIQDEILALNDSIKSKQTLDRVYELEAKFELVKKDREIELANFELIRQERFQLFLKIIIGVILLFSLIAILLILHSAKLKRALLSQEIDTLRVQINSVFGGGAKSLNLSIELINKGLYKPLSDREYEILQLAVSDKNNGEIAESIFVSVNTVKFHLKNIYEKLGVSNRKEALEFLISKS